MNMVTASVWSLFNIFLILAAIAFILIFIAAQR